MPEARPRLLQIGSFLPEFEARFAAGFAVAKLPASESRAAFLAGQGAGIVAVATTQGLPAEVAAALPDLEVVASFGVGYDSIDAAAMAARGVLVTNTPDVLNDEVADTALMLWLAVSKRLVAADAWARSGRWEHEGDYPLTRSIRNRTVGIVGLGRIGLTIARLAETFGARILYHARSARPVAYAHFPDLVAMARAAEVLIVITPGGAATRHLVNAEVIDALGPEGILINVARGSVVDEAALAAALAAGRLGGAGLDVFEAEPRITEALKSMENVVLAPHIGSATVETRWAMGDLVTRNLERWRADGGVVTPVPECRHLTGG